MLQKIELNEMNSKVKDIAEALEVEHSPDLHPRAAPTLNSAYKFFRTSNNIADSIPDKARINPVYDHVVSGKRFAEFSEDLDARGLKMQFNGFSYPQRCHISSLYTCLARYENLEVFEDLNTEHDPLNLEYESVEAEERDYLLDLMYSIEQSL